jgi:hypothetical protein
MITNRPALLSLVVVIIGCCLVMGGGMVFVVAPFNSKATHMLLPAALQIALGILGAIAGILLQSQPTTAKSILAFVAVAVAANFILAVSAFVRMVTQS